MRRPSWSKSRAGPYAEARGETGVRKNGCPCPAAGRTHESADLRVAASREGWSRPRRAVAPTGPRSRHGILRPSPAPGPAAKREAANKFAMPTAKQSAVAKVKTKLRTLLSPLDDRPSQMLEDIHLQEAVCALFYPS